MIRGAATPVHVKLRATGFAVALLLGAWCVPVLASSGVTIRCDQSEKSLPEADIQTSAPLLAARTESSLNIILEDDNGKAAALADTNSDTLGEQLDAGDTVEETAIQGSETSTITTRLPGVSESTLPSFRQQMLRTDI